MRKRAKMVFDSRVIVGAVGLFLSVALHELFHIAMHVGHITNIALFTNRHTIVEISATAASEYNVELEEAIAYTVTILTLLATIVVIGMLHDKKDTRSFNDIVHPKRQLQTHELRRWYELVANK